eukprot:scaffold111303_cov66-Phaeocystis_antarctica.AAC.1
MAAGAGKACICAINSRFARPVGSPPPPASCSQARTPPGCVMTVLPPGCMLSIFRRWEIRSLPGVERLSPEAATARSAEPARAVSAEITSHQKKAVHRGSYMDRTF